MKGRRIKHSAILTRNHKADEIIREMLRSGELVGGTFPLEKIEKGNARALVYKFRTAAARCSIGSKYGMKGPAVVSEPSRWNHKLAAKIIVNNMIRSADESKMNRTFRINKILMFGYMAIIRLLLSF